MNEIKTSIRVKTENQIMELIQEFASSWSLVGGRYDDGSMLENANNLKQEIRSAYEALQKENGLLKLALVSKCDLLKSCESALDQSHATNVTQAKRISELEELMNSEVK